MLTEAEHECTRLLGEAWNVFSSQIVAKGPTTAHDCAEFVHHIHALQHMVMSQAAARAHPDRYRLLGGTLAREFTPETLKDLADAIRNVPSLPTIAVATALDISGVDVVDVVDEQCHEAERCSERDLNAAGGGVQCHRNAGHTGRHEWFSHTWETK